MLTIHVLPRRLKEFLLTHPLYKSTTLRSIGTHNPLSARGAFHPPPAASRIDAPFIS